MPNDNVTNRTFAELFDGNVRYIIPFFQRGYAWQKRQWEDLFDDLRDQIISDLEDGVNIQEVEHFFGPIVVQSDDADEGGIQRYLVVDGQQRITTIYLLLGIITEQLMTKRHLAQQATDYGLKLRDLLTNKVERGDDYRRMKVFSGKGDRLPTYRVIFGEEQNPSSPFYDTDVRLYRKGHNQVEAFYEYASKRIKKEFNDVQSLWQLAQVLLTCLKIVWIPLRKGKDDAQAIFESLNDKGMALSASELLCSFLFRPLANDPDFERLHNTDWLDSIRICGGREPFEEFLRYLFSIGERKMVGKGRKVYVHFKSKNRHLNISSARQCLAEIREAAPLYENIVEPMITPHHDNVIRTTLQSIKDTRMDVCTPFLIAVLRALKTKQLSEAKARAMLRETLVLLVRRKMTELPTTIYDVMFPSLFDRVAYEPDPAREMHQQFRNHNVWVSNQDFEEALVKRILYRSRDIPFTKMVLRELDKTLHSFGQFPDYSTLDTIEHTIPQTLDGPWKEYLGEDAKSESLATVVHTVGNLCLLSGPANSSAGRDPFEQKQNAYPDITGLAKQIKEHPGPWTIEAVRSRSQELAQRALVVWSWGQS